MDASQDASQVTIDLQTVQKSMDQHKQQVCWWHATCAMVVFTFITNLLPITIFRV